MGITRRKFTLEFKTEAAHRVIDTGRSVIDVGAPLTGSVGHGVQPSVSTTTTEGRGRSANARAMPAAMLVPPPPTSSTWEARLTQRTDVASTSHHRGLEASWSCNSRAQIFRSGLFCGRLWDRLKQPELPERPDQQELKIDRSFVTGISASAKDQAIVAATVSLACSLGVRLVAEGVETLADWWWRSGPEVGLLGDAGDDGDDLADGARGLRQAFMVSLASTATVIASVATLAASAALRAISSMLADISAVPAATASPPTRRRRSPRLAAAWNTGAVTGS